MKKITEIKQNQAKILASALAFLLVFCTSACALKPKAISNKLATTNHVTRILVAPFRPATNLPIASETLERATQKAYSLLESSGRFIPVSSKASASGGVSAPSGLIDYFADQASKLGADAALVGLVEKETTRVGKSYGAERVAAVRTRLYLVDAQSKTVLWTSTIDRVDTAVSENLFAIGEKAKSGFGFKTSSELLESSLAEALENLKNQASS